MLINKNNDETLRLPLGGVEDELNDKESYHIFTNFKAECLF
jgi:hypothetical protein